MRTRFGEHLSSGSRVIFWRVSPAAAVPSSTLTRTVDPWSAAHTSFEVGFDAVIVLGIMARYDPRRLGWAARARTGAVLLICVSDLVREIRSGRPSNLLRLEGEDIPTGELAALSGVGLLSL